MKNKTLKLLILACVCALAALTVFGCSQPAPASRSASESFSSVASEPVASASEEPVEPFWALVIGNDTRYQTADDNGSIASDGGNCYSDTIMLMRIDPVNFHISELTIPRDTLAPYGDEWGKINDSHYNDGPEGTVEKVKELMGIDDIPYYFDMSFVQYANLIDALGGVDVNVQKAISFKDIISGEKIGVDAGEQKVNGAQALILSRVRKSYGDNGDAVRQMYSREIVQAGIEFVMGQPKEKAADFAKLIVDGGKSNMTVKELQKYIEIFMDHKDETSFQLGTGPYIGGDDPVSGLWVTPRDEETYGALRDMMLNDPTGDLTTIVPLQPVY